MILHIPLLRLTWRCKWSLKLYKHCLKFYFSLYYDFLYFKSRNVIELCVSMMFWLANKLQWLYIFQTSSGILFYNKRVFLNQLFHLIREDIGGFLLLKYKMFFLTLQVIAFFLTFTCMNKKVETLPTEQM